MEACVVYSAVLDHSSSGGYFLQAECLAERQAEEQPTYMPQTQRRRRTGGLDAAPVAICQAVSAC
jgi:hypothetical protein